MKKYISKGLAFLAVAFGMTGCLEDKGYTDLIRAEGAQPIVSIFGADGGALRVVSFKLNEAKEVTYKVNLGSPEVLTKDVSVTLGASSSALAIANAARTSAGDEPYSALPATAYQITPNPVVIKAGTRDASFTVKVTVPAALDFSKEYIIPVGITSAGDAKIASNLGYVNIGVGGLPNQYEGVYQSVGYFQHPTAPRDINKEKTLKSIDKATVETEFADLGGSYIMWLKVAKDNKVTIIPKETAANVSDFQQTGTNVYDPATKTFTLSYKYVGGNGDRVITEKLTKK